MNENNITDRVLRAIRDTEPAPALEQRILAAVRARGSRPTLTWPRWSLAFVSAAALLATVTLLSNRATGPQTYLLNALSSKLKAHQEPRKLSPLATAAAAPTAAILEASHATESQPFLLNALSSKLKAHQEPERLSPPAAQLSADQQAFNDTHAPSMLAPPMPLTPQERLLVHATRPGSPTELAELEPSRELALREEMKAREHAAIERYMQHMLAPLVTSESLNPTPPTPADAPATTEEPAAPPN